ncbi:MAG: PilC/PilY family type IV pilus protein [Methylococcales bacterium]
MNTLVKKIIYSYFISILIISCLYPVNAIAVVSSHTMAEFTQFPLLTTDSASVQPMVMINSSIDHQLYFKVYNDYSDLDNDGIEDLTYKHSVDYYGYFDSYKCYSYNASASTTSHGNGRFEPDSITADKYCNGSTWSGNFLNWSTMSRIDAIRKILFGGHRRIDSATETVLERSYLPNDAHSWVKYYASTTTEINKLTPFNSAAEVSICNTTVNNTSAVSEDVTNPPLLRIASGNYSLWASNERWQCRWYEEKTNNNANDSSKSGINASKYSPRKNNVKLGLGDYTVRVKACVTGKIGNENCKLYPGADGSTGTGDDIYKPIGLFQVYGDEDRLWFGMMGGSFSKNKSGGTLIKDMGTITDEINVNTDGSFTSVGLYASDNGVSNNRAWGLINAWSVYRIIKYKHSDGTYGTSGLNNNNCTWGKNSFSDGQCQNWGNPFSEIYLNSVRYFAGQSVSGTYRSNDSNELPALQTPQTFSCPLDDSNYCARLNIINFNSSVISYDYDDLDGNSDGVSSIGSSKTSKQLTDIVGDGEGISGNDYFIGQLLGGSGTDINQLCTSKTIASFGNAIGLCSEAPRLEGSYRVAGISHFAHTNDIRSSGPQELEGDQEIDTYSVALAAAIPKIVLKVPGSATKTVTLLPACQNSTVGGNCALVDFKIVTPYTLAGSTATGKLYVNWEDSEQGGDFDQDMWGTIDYEISASAIKITTDVHAKSTPYKMGFGYVLSGTNNDGFHTHSGINGYSGFDCSNCNDWNASTFKNYNIADTVTKLLQDPLWYAAKWGGFTDSDSDKTPNIQSEWDSKINLTGQIGSDGIPDNYFFATNPIALEAALIRVFDDILSKTASGTAAAVVANSREGIGALYQATFVTAKDIKNNDGTTDSVKWYGQLHALWMDSYGLMREDNNGNAVLDDYQTDLVIDLEFSEVDRKTTITRYNSCSADKFELESIDGSCVISASINNDLSTLKPIWNARKQLSAVTDYETQRSYSASAATGRYIFTWIDTDTDGEADAGEIVPLHPDSLSGNTKHRFFDVATETQGQHVIEFIRGKERDEFNSAPGNSFRNRTADIDADGTKDRLILGDIVNSTPTPVGTPSEAFDLLYNDDSYAIFRSLYKNRRSVVYVGANDGLIHAFNSGFYNSLTKSFTTSRSGETAHPLGSELWAYAPMNLLPHLKWLTRPDYSHVYYMDSKPRVFDAKIFTADTNHPGGWGTVLVVGMNFGGGEMSLDIDDNGSFETSMHSSYVLMDITNPEEAPTLIAEITHSELAFTHSYPTAFAIRDADNSSNNGWFLAFGSGPTNFSGQSTQQARFYIYDLVNKAFVNNYDPYILSDAKSFIGSPVSVDWNLKFKADSLYFGTAAAETVGSGGNAVEEQRGKMYKMKINQDIDPGNWSEPELFYNSGQPSLPTPTVSFDSSGNHWVFWGTGRLLVADDLQTTMQQYIYGVKDIEDKDGTALAGYAWDLVDVSGVQIFTDDSLTGVTNFDIDGDGTTDTIDSYAKLKIGMDYKNGWKRNLPANGTDPSERALTTAALIGEVLFLTSFEPGTNLCNSLGNSDLYALSFITGTALPPSVLGTDDLDGNPLTADLVLDHVNIGHGISSSPSIHKGTGTGDKEVTVVTQTGVGAIDTHKATVSESVKHGEMSWRELYQ